MKSLLHPILEGFKSKLPPKILFVLNEFIPTYIQNAQLAPAKSEELLKAFINLVIQQIEKPYAFELFHKSIRTPFDYHQFGLEFIKPLVNFNESRFEGVKQFAKIKTQLEAGENAILFSNHQIEPDPQVIGLLLESSYPSLVENMVFVAGHRVTTDPLAVPLSLGCNLLCIYSKKHIHYPPKEKPQKVQHNQRTLQKMVQLLQEGGQCIYVAPSGGRDRASAFDIVEVAPFDSANIELFRLMAQQSQRLTHFYPLALSSYSLLPPPKHIEKEVGEMRQVCYAPIKMAIGEELAMDDFPGSHSIDKRELRAKRSEHIWKCVCDLYAQIQNNKNLGTL